MKLSLTKILLLVAVVILSVTIGNISTIIRVHLEPRRYITSKDKGSELHFTSNSHKNISSDSFDDLIWFLQISDIHISIFRDISRVTDLEEFCKVTVDVIKPAVVLASGDLTDAKNVDTLGSRQYEDEWKLYRDALDKYAVTKKTVWLDVRGNHDNFNVPGPASKENLYRNYSIQGGSNPRSYLHTVRVPSGQVFSFIALDACLDPGPKRPFNFFGLVNKKETEHLEQLIRQAQDEGSRHSVWFGHYPTSCILSAASGVRRLIASDPGAMAYFCGHLHSMGGLVPHMYTLQQDGFLELELSDWKDSRTYRLAAIDQGLFSFTDITHNEWPVILITNPKHALFSIPERESTQHMVTTSHIRVLAFSTTDIVSVRVKLNEGDWQVCSHVEGPLYVRAWTPQSYSRGLHTIKVEVVDKAGQLKYQEQPFSLDGTRLSFGVVARILLMSNITTVFQALFGVSIMGCVVPLSLLRLMLTRVRAGKICVPTTSFYTIRQWYRRLWIMANLDTFYYPLILYPLYITLGPWAIGEIIENHIGVIFAWGIVINGAYLPGSFTYGYGFFQMLTFQFPLMLVLAYKLDQRMRGCVGGNRSRLFMVLNHWWSDLPFYLISFTQFVFLYFFWLSYGSLAILLGPFRSWPLFNVLWLWRQVHQTSLRQLKDLADTFEEVNCDSPRLKSSHSI